MDLSGLEALQTVGLDPQKQDLLPEQCHLPRSQSSRLLHVLSPRVGDLNRSIFTGFAEVGRQGGRVEESLRIDLFAPAEKKLPAVGRWTFPAASVTAVELKVSGAGKS